ncbi:MAG: hypothetical protein WD081_08860 [Gammaproteobacteria bacterium]
MQTRIPAVLAVLVLLAACAGPTGPLAEVVPQPYPGADATHPVRIVELNGVNLDGTRAVITLPPGRHEVVMTAIIEEPTLLRSAHASNIPIRHALVLEVVDGMRYTVAAYATGPTTEDWLPVLVRVEEMKR